MRTPAQIVEEFAEMGDRFTFSLKDGTYFEGYVLDITDESFTFAFGGPLAPEEPVAVKYSDLNFNTLCFHDPVSGKYKDAWWSGEENRWIVTDCVRPNHKSPPGKFAKTEKS